MRGRDFLTVQLIESTGGIHQGEGLAVRERTQNYHYLAMCVCMSQLMNDGGGGRGCVLKLAADWLCGRGRGIYLADRTFQATSLVPGTARVETILLLVNVNLTHIVAKFAGLPIETLVYVSLLQCSWESKFEKSGSKKWYKQRRFPYSF
jgi:hypothetical protein